MTGNKTKNRKIKTKSKRTPAEQKRISDAVAELKRLSNRNTLGGISWKELRDVGRK